MKILAPLKITDAVLKSSTVAETDHPEWVVGTTYAIGEKVIRTSTHRRYEALTANTGKTPETSPTDWLDLGPTNRWAAFDEKVGTVTSATGALTIVLEPGMINALALVNVTGAHAAQITMTDPTYGVVFDKTLDLRDLTGINNWWAYYFEPRYYRDSAIVEKLPTSRNPEVSVTLTGPATVAIGALLVGRMHVFAPAAHYGARVGIVDYSRKGVDDWGNTQIVKRASSKRASWEVLVERTKLDSAQKLLNGLRATPAVYIGSDLYDATILYGFYRDFDQIIEYPNHWMCSIEIESLT